MASGDGYKDVTKENPCPLCGKVDWCQRSDGGFIHCMRSTAPPIGWMVVKNTDRGGVIYRRETDRDNQRRVKLKTGESPAAPVYYTKMAEELAQAITNDQIATLAAELGVTPNSLVAIQVGWHQEQAIPCFPERDEIGRVIGINRRMPNGLKKQFAKHRRGLIVPFNLERMPDPVLIVEGASDVAACLVMGLTAVGRPGKDQGGDILAKLLRGREVLVVAEWDRKPDGSWPGKDGAIKISQRLAAAWGHTIRWALPAGGGNDKDTRSWLKSRSHGPAMQARPDELTESGKIYLDALIAEANEEEISAAIGTTGQRMMLSNVDDSGGGKHQHYIPIASIAGALAVVTDKWPRRCQGELFALQNPTPPNEVPSTSQIWRIKNTDALFAWIAGRADIRWAGKDCTDATAGAARTPIRRREFYEYLMANATPAYSNIETVPHHPPIEGAYYVPCQLPDADGSALAEFSERLNAETENDRKLMIAAAITPGWGGPPGARPAFVFMTTHGRGVGKSTTARLISELWGGSMDVAEDEDWEKVRKRFVNNSKAQRMVVIDNIKRRLSKGGLEGAMTSPTIDGDKHYVGQASVPNFFTWFMTANTPNLSADLSDRAVVIHLGKPKHSSDYEKWKHDFIKNRRAAFIADAIAMLAAEPVSEIKQHDRWKQWQEAVLARIPDSEGLAEFIIAQRPEVDSDLADADEVGEAISSFITAQRCDPLNGKYSIPKSVIHQVLQDAKVGRRNATVKQTTGWIKTMGRIGLLVSLGDDPDRSHGRCWLWTGQSEWSQTAPKVFLSGTGGRGKPDETDDGLPI